MADIALRPHYRTRKRLAVSRNELVEFAIGCVSFFMMTIVILNTFFPLENYLASKETGEVSLPVPVNAVTWFFSGCFLIFLYFRVVSRRQRFIHFNAIYVFMACVVLSAVWSHNPNQTMVRALRFFVSGGLGIAFANYYGFRTSMKLFVCAFLLSALLSIGVSIAFPSLGLSRIGGAYEQAWRGAQNHKNYTGLVYALGALVALYAGMFRFFNRYVCIACVLACAVMAIMANSATSSVAAIGAIAIWCSVYAVSLLPRRMRFFAGIAVLLAGLAATMSFLLLLDSVVGASGRNLTLTGRTIIWEAVWNLIKLQPWLGYGYAFWTSGSSGILYVWQYVGDTAAHSHNTWLDIWLQLGIVPVVLMAFIFLGNSYRSFMRVISSSDHLASVCFAIMMYWLIRSFTEITVTDPSPRGVFWVCWIAVILRMYPPERPRMPRNNRRALR